MSGTGGLLQLKGQSSRNHTHHDLRKQKINHQLGKGGVKIAWGRYLISITSLWPAWLLFKHLLDAALHGTTVQSILLVSCFNNRLLLLVLFLMLLSFQEPPPSLQGQHDTHQVNKTSARPLQLYTPYIAQCSFQYWGHLWLFGIFIHCSLPMLCFVCLHCTHTVLRYPPHILLNRKAGYK